MLGPGEERPKGLGVGMLEEPWEPGVRRLVLEFLRLRDGVENGYGRGLAE